MSVKRRGLRTLPCGVPVERRTCRCSELIWREVERLERKDWMAAVR